MSKKDYSVKEMAVLAIATSIDALAVGISLAIFEYRYLVRFHTDWCGEPFAIAAFGGLAGFKLGAMAGKKS